MQLVFLILGLIGLVLGAELAVRGILEIAERYRISQVFLGITAVAVGTDLPEVAVSITAAFKKIAGFTVSDFVIGESLGSVMSQSTVILGIALIYGSIRLTKKFVERDMVILVGSLLLFTLLAWDGTVSRLDGGVLLLFYGYYIFQLIREERLYEKWTNGKEYNPFWAALSVLGGFALLIFSANFTVDNALYIANVWGLSQTFVGVMIVGLGTSLPELATSISAMRKGANDLVLGNIVGSSIFDAVVPISVGALVSTFRLQESAVFANSIVILLTMVLLLYVFRQMKILKKREGFLLIAIYLVYVIWQFHII